MALKTRSMNGNFIQNAGAEIFPLIASSVAAFKAARASEKVEGPNFTTCAMSRSCLRYLWCRDNHNALETGILNLEDTNVKFIRVFECISSE